MDRHRYIVIGAGAVGGTIGGLLTRAGIPTVLVARGEHASALEASGLRLRTPDEDLTIPVTVATAVSDLHLTIDDVLVFATKTHQLDAALLEWVDQAVHDGDTTIGTAGELLPVLTALNGVSAEEKALRFFSRVFGVAVWAPSSFMQPGEVIARSAPVSGVLHIGRWPSTARAEADAAFLERVRDDWASTGLLVHPTDDPEGWKYEKLVANLRNAVTALVGSPGEATTAIADAVKAEAIAVLDALGIQRTPSDDVARWRAQGPTPRPVPGVPDGVGTSTWQSLARGSGSVETDFLNGEIVRLAHRAGLEAPINASLSRLAREAARNGAEPGTHSAERLAVELGVSPG